ncbi:MAG: 16S rRNA (guanine(527)-N(7))-methyltransferase RsmG [Chloroflexota bacterium]
MARSKRRRRGRLSRRLRTQTGESCLDVPRDPLPTRVDGLPALPSAYDAALQPALDALEPHGLTIGAEQREAMETHIRLLLAWTEAINLTAITDPELIARQHVADALAAIPILHAGPLATLLDVGSGGGFPGLPLAICLPSTRVTLVESVRKKAAFLDVAVRATGLSNRVTVVPERAEMLAPGRWDVVTARAVGSLADLIEVGLPLLGVGGQLAVWKRGDLANELATAGTAARTLGGTTPAWHPYPDDVAGAVGLAGHGIVIVRKIAPSPAGYPRDPAVRKRRIW